MSKIELLSKIIGSEKTNALAVKYFKACPPYSNKTMLAHFLKQHPLARVIPASKILPAFFKIYYGNCSPDEIVPDESTPFASAHVPFSRGRTNLLFFNFLQRNYGIRDPLLIRLSIMRGEEFFWSKQYLFTPNEVKYITNLGSEADTDVLPEQGIVLLEAFHPRIKTPGNEFRFFVFFRDGKKGLLSGVHSIPAPLQSYVQRQSLCYRGYIPQGNYAYLSNFADPRQEIEISGPQELFSAAKTKDPLKGANGFCIIHDGDGAPFALWHDNCTSAMSTVKHTLSADKKPQNCVTAFYIPDFKLNAPLIRVSAEEVGFPVESMTLKIHLESGEMIGQKTIHLVEDKSGFDLAKIFEDINIEGGVYCVADFHRDQNEFTHRPAMHLHVYYRGPNHLADQSHSQYSNGLRNDSDPQPRSYRCLKMAPLFKNLRSVFAVVTAGGNQKNPDNTITLRVFTDMGTEHVFNKYPLSVSDGVSIIHGDNLLKEIGQNICEAAVVWFEHQTSNYSGLWYAIDRDTGHLATDHFTGA
jgi:hypothetical protein